VSNDRLDELDYYTLLGVADDASTEAIKSAFRSFARRYHPDRFVDADEEKLDQATRIFRRGSEAFQVLTDETQRQAYDHVLRSGKLRLTEDAKAGVKPGGMLTPKPGSLAAQAASSRSAASAASAGSRTAQEQRATPDSPDNPIRTDRARALFKHAVDAAKSQDWATAWKALRAANDHEPGNAFLETRFRQVDAMLRKQ